MKKTVPKIPQRGLFKKLTLFDTVYVIVMALILILVISSNLPIIKYIIAAILVVCVGLSELRKDGVSMARSLLYKLISLTKPTDYVKDVEGAVDMANLYTVDKIENGIITYKSGAVARFIELEDVSFVLKDEAVQEAYQSAFAKCFDIVAPARNVTLIKTEREIDLISFKKNIKTRVNAIRNRTDMTEEEKTARVAMLKSIVKQYTEIQGNVKKPVFHLVVRENTVSELDVTVDALMEELNSADIIAKRASTENIAIALAMQMHKKIDITKLHNMSDEKLSNYIYPLNAKVGAKYIDIDGKHITTYAVNNLPPTVENAWLAALCNVTGLNVTINVGYVNSRNMIRRIDNAYFSSGVQLENTVKLSESVNNSAQQGSMEELTESIEYGKEQMCKLEILVSFENTGADIEKEVSQLLLGLKMKRNVCKYRQFEYYKNALASSLNKPIKTTSLLFTTSAMGMAFPMVFPNMLEPNGDFIGYTKTGIPLVYDFNARDGAQRVSSNMCAIGKTGSGKSFFLKLYLLNRAASGEMCFVFDPEDEYSKIAKAYGGVCIDLSKGNFKINPLQPSSISADGKNSISEHIDVLETFFSTLFPGMPKEQLLVLKEQIAALYGKFNITDDADVRNITPKQFPILSDLYALIEESYSGEKDEYIKPLLAGLRLYLRSFLSGHYAIMWNGYSAIDMNTNFAVFNLQSMLASGNLATANAQLYLLSRIINAKMIENYQSLSKGGAYKRILVLVDEVHRLLSPSMPVALDMCSWLAKQCRKYEGALVVASQSIIDFTANEELKSKSKSLLTESQTTLLFGCKSTHMPDLLEIYKKANFSEAEQTFLQTSKQGEALLMATDSLRLMFKTTANPCQFKFCVREIDNK